MKSVTIKDADGKVLIKVLHRKNGLYEVIKHPDVIYYDVEVRDDKNCKVHLS